MFAKVKQISTISLMAKDVVTIIVKMMEHTGLIFHTQTLLRM